MSDLSYLDQKYFIDEKVYNCPFCKRNHIRYTILDCKEFNWLEEKKAFAIFIMCNGCKNISMHLTYEKLVYHSNLEKRYYFSNGIEDIDSKIFYSHPSSYFTIDNRIDQKLRKLIEEAEGCRQMNFLTGASACIRKAIYEFLLQEKLIAKEYDNQIKELKKKYPNISENYFNILGKIKGITSDQVHENSYKDFSRQHINLLIKLLQELFLEIYVLPKELKNKHDELDKLYKNVEENNKDNKAK